MSEDRLPRAAPGDEHEDAVEAGEDPLRRAAAEIRASSSLQALVPLSLAEREQLVDEALDRALGNAAPPEPRLAGGGRARRGAAWAPYAAALALAAAVALYFAAGRSTVEPLAAYSLAVEGEQATRGAAGSEPTVGPVKVRPGTRLVLTLASDRPERDALLRVVLVRGGRATLLDAPVTCGKGGALTIEGPAAELLGPQGDGAAEIVVVLGRALPSDEEIRALALGATGAPRHLQVKRRAIVLEGFSLGALEPRLGGHTRTAPPSTTSDWPVPNDWRIR